MEQPTPLNFTRKFFGDQANNVTDLDLIQSFAKQRNISTDTPLNQIVAQLEEQSLGKLREQNAGSNLKTTRRLFGEAAFGIDDNTLALSFAKSQGLNPDTPLSDVFEQMEETSALKMAEADKQINGDQIFGVNQIRSSIDFLREQDDDGRSGFSSTNPVEDFDLRSVSSYLRPESTRPNLFERVGQEVLSLDFFTQDIAKNISQTVSEAKDDTGRTALFNEIEDELNNPDAIARFVAETERFKANPELFTEAEKRNLFNAAKLYETTNTQFDVEKTGVGEFLTSMNKTIVQPISKGINQIFGTAFDAAGIDQDFTDQVLRDLNFTDQVLAETDPESKAAIAGNIMGSVAQTVISIMSGAGPAAMFALYGTQGAGGNIESYRALAREKGFDPELGEQAMVGLGGMVISGGLGALLTGKTIGQLPLIKSFQEGGEKALFEAANRSGLAQGLTRDVLFNTGLDTMAKVMATKSAVGEVAKSYLRFAASTGTVEAIEETSEEALNELLQNAVIEEFETDPREFMKRLGLSAVGGLVGGAFIGPAVKSRVRKETRNASRNILGLSDIAPESIEEARVNLDALNSREAALKDRFNGNLPAIFASDIAETRAKLQTVVEGAITPQEAFPQTEEKKTNPFGRFVSPLGDIASNGRLKGTGFQEAAEAGLSQDEVSIAGGQVEAFREFLNRVEDSDLPADVKRQIAGRARMSRMSTAGRRRNAVTLHDVDERGNKSLHGIYFTNGSDKKSAIDELFHVIVDPAAPEVQQSIVDGFNQTYNARAKDYDSEKTRDRIASRVAAIVSGEEELPDVDNAFTQAVRSIQNGEFTNVNLDLAGGIRQTTQGPTRPVAIDELNKGLNDGTFRMVSVPGLEDKTTFQDNNNTVFEYVLTEDSEGEATGHVVAVGSFEKLPSIGVPNTRAIAPFTGNAVRIPGATTEENNNQLRKEVFRDVQDRLRKRNLIPTDPVAPEQSLVVAAGANDTQILDILSTHIQRLAESGQEIPLRLLERFQQQSRVAGLLPPAQTEAVRQGEGTLESASRANPDPFNPNVNTGSVAADQQLAPSQAAGVPALGPETFDQERLVELASEAIRILEARGEPVPQALLDIITVDAEITDADPATPSQVGTERPQLQQGVSGPTSFVEFLEATDQLPDQFASQLRDRLQSQRREQRLLPAAEQTAEQPPANPVLAELDPQIANNLPAELVPAVEALITGNEIEGVQSIGEPDAVTGFPLMQVSAEAADALAAAGVAVNGRADIGGTVTETLPEIISFNPDALAEVATATQPVESNVGVESAMQTFNDALVDSDSLSFVTLEDEAGDTVRYSTPQAARQSLENQFAGETESNPGRGNDDIITIGSREFIMRKDSEPTSQVLERGFGDRAPQIGALLDALEDGPAKTRLLKAAKRVRKQLQFQAKGSSAFNESTLTKAFDTLDTVISEVNPGIELQQLTGSVGVDPAADGTDQEGVSEVQAALEAADQTEQEIPVDLNDSDVKAGLRRMRQRVKRSRFNRVDNTGLAEFRSTKESAINSFVDKAQELGATQMDRRKIELDGKSEHVVQVQFHPEVANRIFGDVAQQATSNPVTLFTNPTPIDPDSDTITQTTVLQPTFSRSVGGRITSAVVDVVKGLKIRANVHVTTYGDLRSGNFTGETENDRLFADAQNFANVAEISEADGQFGVAFHRVDSEGRVHAIIAVNDTLLNVESDEAMEIVSHELGHVIEKDVLSREEHDAAFQQLSEEHSRFVESAQEMTVSEFLREQRTPVLFDTIINGEQAANMTMSQLRNDPGLRQFYDYVTSFEEWFADQTARWMTSPTPETTTKEKTSLFKAIGKRIRSMFDRFKSREAFPPNKTFESWVNGYVESLQEGQVNFVNPQVGTRQDGRSISQEDSMPLEAAINPMVAGEVDARKANQFEFSINGELALLRDEIPGWTSLEQAVRQGQSAAGTMPTQELVDKARRYEQLYQASIALANRPAPIDMPLDVMASYSTSAGLFSERFSQRLDDYYQAYRESTFNQIRRRLLSPVITRQQIVVENNPELESLKILTDKVFASAGRRAGGVPFVDKVQQEITLRTEAVGRVVNPIFEAFGFSNTGIQRAAVGLVRGKKLNEVVKQVYMGVRNKEWLTQAELNAEYNGVKMETIIDNMRKEMDKLRDYAVSKGLLTEDEFITYEDGNVEHYVPRVYDRETVRANFDHFKVHVIERNLRHVYRQDAYIEFLAESDPAKIQGLTDEELKDIQVPDSFKLEAEDEQNVVEISENIAANIAFGRTATFAKQFNPESFSGHENFIQVIDKYGTRVPDRLKRRKIFFVDDQELLGRVEVNGRKINYLETNIVDVMGRSIEQIVKRGEYKEIFEDGKVFATAYQDLKDKKRNAETNGDVRTSKSVTYDMEAVDALYESVAEVVDLDAHKSIQNGPVRDLLSSFARTSTVSVMGLSTILAIVELGNIPLRVGLVPGMKAVLGKTFEIGLKKLAKWPGAAIGKGENYTDRLEDELTIMGYLHTVGEDFAARVRTDNPFDSDSRGARPLGTGTIDETGSAPGEFTAKVARNLSSGLEFVEDVFYRVTLLESMTRLSQVVAAHAANDMLLDIMNTSDAGPLNSAQNRELKRLGFVDDNGNLDMEAFNEYKQFHSGLRNARKKGKEAIQAYADANQEMFRGAHFRVTTRLVNQMIARPNVVTRPRWGNSKNPIKRMMYRLRSFTHGYRELAARFYTDEFKNVGREEGAWGIARMLARFLPLLFMAGMSIVARAELSATVHSAVGNETQAKRIRTLQAEKDPIDFMIEAFDKTGMTLQASEAIGAVEGLRYGNSIFAVVGGVTASKLEKLAETSMQTAVSGDPAFLWNNMVDFSPGANTGVWDGLKLETQKTSSQNKSDMDHFGMLNGSQANWW